MITGFYAGILALIYAGLSFVVIRTRIRQSISLGDNGDETMARKIRAHANFAEYAPFLLLLMAIYEMQADNLYLLHVFGTLLVGGRVLHAVGLRRNIMAARAGGTVLTLTLMVILALMLIVNGVSLMPAE